MTTARLSSHFRPTPALGAALMLCLLGALSNIARADTGSDVVTLKVESRPLPPPPSEDRTAEPAPINPTTTELHDTLNPLPAGEPSSQVGPGQPAPSFRTLADAAAAGVNPLAPVKSANLAIAVAPQQSSWVSRLWFIWAGLGFLVLIGGAYVVVNPRIRRSSVDE